MFGLLSRFHRAKEPPKTQERAAADRTLDHVAPDGCLEEPDCVQLGAGQFVRSCFLAQYPGTVWVGWLDDLYGATDVDVSVHLLPEQPATIVRRLTDRIEGLQAQLELDDRRGNISRRHLLTRDITEADTLRARVQWREDTVYSAAVVFTVTAASREALDRRCQLLERELQARMAEARCLFLRQVPGLVTASPVGAWELGTDCTRLMNLGAVTGFYPFGMADMAHPHGVLLGVNRVTGGPVIYDSFAGPAFGLTNPHAGVFAQTGAGKTVLLKVKAARAAAGGRHVVILDPEGEYTQMVMNLGGHVIRLEPGRPAGINPLDLEAEEADAETAGTVNLQDKIADVRALVAHMISIQGGSLTPEESALLDRVVLSLYTERGISHQAESLYETVSELGMDTYHASRRKKPVPRLRDLHAGMAGVSELRRVALLLEPFLAQGSMGLFDCETAVGLDKAMIVFDLYGLDERYVRPLAMHVCLGWIAEQFIKKRKGIDKEVYTDEAWMFMKHQDTAAFLENLARRARKRRCGLTLASQSFAEFQATETGRAVLNNLGTRVVMAQKPEQLAQAAEVFQLTEGERAFVARAGRGEALIKTGSQSVALLVELTPEEKALLAIPDGD